MPKRLLSVPRSADRSDLEIVSHGRGGPGARQRLTPEQIAQVARTMRKTPEVMVKVSGGAREVAGAKAHFDYIDRHGKLGIETDEGVSLVGKGAGAELVADWNLDLSRGQYREGPKAGQSDRRPKLVHHIVLSMPGRTPPEAVLAAARSFARENFALQHRYAMVLHTDQAHPHVHLVVKAEHEYEPNKRLHITKPMLQRWREDFAAALRAEGVAANATPSRLRGRPGQWKKDGIYRRLKAAAAYDALPEEAKAQRAPPKESTVIRQKVDGIARALQEDRFDAGPGRERLLVSRRALQAEWLATAEALHAQGESQLASEVERFVAEMPAARTEAEQIASGLLALIEAQRQRSAASGTEPDKDPTR